MVVQRSLLGLLCSCDVLLSRRLVLVCLQSTDVVMMDCMMLGGLPLSASFVLLQAKPYTAEAVRLLNLQVQILLPLCTHEVAMHKGWAINATTGALSSGLNITLRTK